MTDDWNQQQQQQPFDFEGSALPSDAAILVDVRSSMIAPAIAMIVLTVVGMVWTLYCLVVGLLIAPQVNRISQQMGQLMEEDFQRMQEDFERHAAAEQSRFRGSPSTADSPSITDLKSILQIQGRLFQDAATATVVYHTIGLMSGFLILVGAISMLNLKRYPLAITASVLSMIPATSGCCLLGLPIGIWALVTLSRPGVSAAFRS
jgi:hypothetical protein